MSVLRSRPVPWREWWPVAALTLAAALLRLPTISVQSFWLDEGIVSVVVASSLFDTIDNVADTEATPPLYYVATWAWTRVFGDSDVAFRALPALLGVATVPVVYATARDWFSRRAGFIAAALVATSPFLVWYSQEARSYGPGVFLSAVSLFFLQRALRRDERSDFVWWAVFSALALATHYFAAFVAIPAALALIALHGRRAVLPAAAALLPGALLLPLAGQQAGDTRTTWIEAMPLGDRIESTVRAFVSGPTGAPGEFFGLLAAAALAAGLVLGLRTALRDRPSQIALGIGAASLALPLALAVVGIDYFFNRNLIFSWVPLTLLVSAGIAAAPREWAVWGLAGLTSAAFAAISIGIAAEPEHQKEDWQSLARDLGPPHGGNRIMLVAQHADAALIHYGRLIVPLTREGPPVGTVTEVAVVGLLPPDAVKSTPPGLAVIERRDYNRGLRMIRIKPRRTSDIKPNVRQALGLPPAGAYLERAEPAG